VFAREILIERKEDHARDMTREMGKVLAETRATCRKRLTAAYYTLGEGRRLFGRQFPRRCRQVCHGRTPTDWRVCMNHSVELPHGDFVRGSWLPAIVCGNTCVSSLPRTPRFHFNLVRALADAGIAEGRHQRLTGFRT